MRLFSPRKTTLLFVIRDKTKVCLEVEYSAFFRSQCSLELIIVLYTCRPHLNIWSLS